MKTSFTAPNTPAIKKKKNASLHIFAEILHIYLDLEGIFTIFVFPACLCLWHFSEQEHLPPTFSCDIGQICSINPFLKLLPIYN